MQLATIASWISRRPLLAVMSFAATILLAFAAGGFYVIISVRPEEMIYMLDRKELEWADFLWRSREPPPTPVSIGDRIAVPGGAWGSGPVSDGLLMVLVTLEVARHNDGRPICIGLRKSEVDSEEPGKRLSIELRKSGADSEEPDERLSIDMPDFLFEWISPHFPKLVPLKKCVVNFRGMRGIIRNESFPDAHLIVLEQPWAVFDGPARSYYRVSAQSYKPGDIHSYGRTYLIGVERGVANLIDAGGFRAY